MAEEHRCKAPEGHRLCINNCGFFGSPATMNLCSKCYRDFRLKEQQQAASIISSLSSSSSSSSASPPSLSPPVESFSQPPDFTLPEVAAAGDIGNMTVVPGGSDEVKVVAARPNRCFVCRKKVGLTGFKCRCGTTFCGTHRYPEKHECSFDFKKVGREEIAKANPVVIAEKLEKI